MRPHRATRAIPFAILALLPHAAVARTAEQYIAARRAAHFDRSITLAMIEADPAAYLARAGELRGTLNGSSRLGAAVTCMMTLDDGRAVYFQSPSGDTAVVDEVSSQRVRVLICGDPVAARTGAAWKAIAIALDAEVRAIAPDPVRTAPRTEPASRSMPVSRGLTTRPVAAAPGTLTEAAMQYLSPAAQAVYPRYRDFIARHNKRLTAKETDEIAVSILHFSQRHKVDPRLVIAMIIAESDFDPRSTSHKGAMGLGQLMPDEARSFHLTDPYNCIQNVRASVNLLKMRLDSYREPGTPEGSLTWRQIQLAMASYNAGSGAVRKYGGIPPYRETQGYVKRITRLYRELSGQ